MSEPYRVKNIWCSKWAVDIPITLTIRCYQWQLSSDYSVLRCELLNAQLYNLQPRGSDVIAIKWQFNLVNVILSYKTKSAWEKIIGSHVAHSRYFLSSIDLNVDCLHWRTLGTYLVFRECLQWFFKILYLL